MTQDTQRDEMARKVALAALGEGSITKATKAVTSALSPLYQHIARLVARRAEAREEIQGYRDALEKISRQPGLELEWVRDRARQALKGR